MAYEESTMSEEFINEVKTSEGTAELQGSDGWTDITGQPPSYRDGKFFPYKDTEDNWTIGYGTLLTDDEASEYHDSGITMEAAEGFLNERLTEAGTGAGRLVYNLSNMPTGVQEVVTDLVYNMGETRLREQFPSFLSAIEEENYPLAIENIKYKSPSELKPGADHGELSAYFEKLPGRAGQNIEKLEQVYSESLNTASDDGVFNVVKGRL